jgi:hypothetical protein
LSSVGKNKCRQSEQIDLIDATPNKRIYRSIIADYDLNTGISELIDNAIDVWSTLTGGPDLKIIGSSCKSVHGTGAINT